jgi:hypothetical protein
MGKSIKRSKAKKTQKLWNMKGCSKSKRTLGGKTRRVKRGGSWKKKMGGKHVCHKCPPGCRCGPNCDCGHNCPGNCYLKNKKQKGGNCESYGLCGVVPQNGGCITCLQSGGSANGALVGAPWTPKIADWPGVAGKDGQTNYFSMNKYLVDPQTETISERNQITYTPQNGGTRRSRAGGLIPQDLVNLGRSMVYGVGSAYNSLNGYATPVNPLPYKDQLVNTASSKSLGNF